MLDLTVAARRLALLTVTLSAVVYLLGWFSPMDHLVTGLVLLGGLAAGVWSVSSIGWLPLVAAMAATIGALLGLPTVPTLDGTGALAVECAVLAAVTAVLAWLATVGLLSWPPPTLFRWRPRGPHDRPIRGAPTGIRVPGRHAAPSHEEPRPAPAECPVPAPHPGPRSPVPPPRHARPGTAQSPPADAPTEFTTWSGPPRGHPPELSQGRRGSM